MSHSVSPLGSLSSPSPSPSPPQNPIDESELSELTDDDPDSKIPDDPDPDDNDDDPHPPSRSTKSSSTPSANPSQRQRPYLARKTLNTSRTASAPSSGKRKKRGGLVPAPMWGWAYKNGTAGSPSATPTPAPALDSSIAIPAAGPSHPPQPDPDPTPLPEKPPSNSASPDAEEEEEEELPTPPRAMEEEEGEDQPDLRKDRSLNRRNGSRRSSSRSRGSRRKKVVVPMPFDRDKAPRSKRGVRFMPRISLLQNDALIKRLWEQGYKIYDPNAPTSDEEDGDRADYDTVSEDDDRTSLSRSDDDEMDVDDDAEDQDPTSPPQSPLPILNTNIKLTPPPSTSTVNPAPDKLSVPPSMRASVDPTITPADEDAQPRATPDDDVDPDHYPDALEDDDHPPAQDGDMEQDGDEDEDAQQEEPSQPPSPTPLAEPEPEPEDEDPDLQPAHRAEALDVLATIELKFALLRERVYVEKMEGLAWEEALVWDGTHPELHHLQNELTKRRDKRLTLASKKRTYEIEAASRKKREAETWCWEGWDIARTELQTEMIAETNRKRRKLERERRTIERPPGARRIPNAILNPPPAPTLRQIANTFPLPSHLSHLVANKKLSYAKSLGVYPDGLSGATAYPDLSTLPPHDIATDIDYLFQHRRMGYGFGMGFVPPMGVPMGVGVGAPGFGPPAMGFGGPNPTPVNGLGIGGPADNYPPNPGPGMPPSSNAAQIGGPPLALGSSGPGLSALPPPAPPQNAPNAVPGPGSMPGPGIPNSDGPSFSQPTMGVFQGPPSIGSGPTGYSLGPGGGPSVVIGPGGATSPPVIGPGGTRIQRPSGFVERERELQRDRERELIQREREPNSRDRELAAQREREYSGNVGPGYPAWGPKPAGGMDWGIGDVRRREEKERIERNERDRERERSQVQPIVPTPTHRHLHQRSHSHSHSHTHQLQHPAQPHQPRPVHAHQSHPHQHSQHAQHHPHGQHQHQHTQHQHGASHAPPHHHVGQHHHHKHHHHVVHHHYSSVPVSGASSTGLEGTSPLPQGSGSAPGVQTMEIINLTANPSSKSHRKRDEVKLGGSSIPGSRPPSTHPLPSSHNYDERERERDREWDRDRDRDRERERERDRPIATPFVLGPSHHTISSASSSPRHGWTPGPGEPGPTSSSALSTPFPERFHTPVPHRFPNTTQNGLPRPLTTSPPRAPPSSVSTASPSITAMNVPPLPPSSTGPFPLQRKSSPALPKLNVPLGYSPRLAGPGVVPPTGPGVPGVLSTTGAGPGVTSSGILTSGPGVPPGPGIAPAPVVGGVPGESNGPSLFTGSRTTSPLIPYTGPPIVAVSTQKVGVDGS